MSLKAYNFAHIDSHAELAVRKSWTMLKTITNFLIKPAKSDIEKARAIYTWIAQTIRYDVPLFLSGARPATQSVFKLADRTFLNKKAVCDGYAQLFKAMCDIAGLESRYVLGWSKGAIYVEGSPLTPEVDHAWNMIYLNNLWQPFDVTWGAGSIDIENNTFKKKYSDYWFCTNPAEFIYTHFPEDSQWQSLAPLLTRDAFVALQFVKTFTDFYKRRVEIISSTPRDALLEIGASYHFQFRIPGAENVFFSINDQAELYSALQKQGDIFEGTCRCPQGKLVLFAQFPGKDNRLFGLLEYAGK